MDEELLEWSQNHLHFDSFQELQQPYVQLQVQNRSRCEGVLPCHRLHLGNVVMILASQSFFFFVLTRLPNILKQGFQPAFSALTFPTIITATSLKMAQGILKLPFLDYLVLAETVICLTILFFVLGAYLIWLRKKV